MTACAHYIVSCHLRSIEVFNLVVAPVIDLRIGFTGDGCKVEMLCCKFEGSGIIEQQNQRFAASLRNVLTWDEAEVLPMLHVDVDLEVCLEVFTLPFTLLPLSAVETPGNACMQTLLNRLVPIFLHNLISDYTRWAAGELGDMFPSASPVKATVVGNALSPPLRLREELSQPLA
eukprot:SM000010S04173  [mRNA]  locus=s10:69452:70606:+ [translate_table: standard]